MKKYKYIVIAAASTALFASFQARAAIVDSYFGWNYVWSEAYLGSIDPPFSVPELSLSSITYEGGSGVQTLAMAGFSRQRPSCLYPPQRGCLLPAC